MLQCRRLNTFCVCRRVGGLNFAMSEVEYVLCL